MKAKKMQDEMRKTFTNRASERTDFVAQPMIFKLLTPYNSQKSEVGQRVTNPAEKKKKYSAML